MCSVSGFLANRPISAELASRIAKALLWYGRDRGTQSAGVASNLGLFKRATDPSQFVELPDFKAHFHAPVTWCLAHTRMPTCGDRTDIQAQPFQVNGTITVHNGFYFDKVGIRDEWKLTKPSGVDSELITQFIESYGVEQLPDFLETTDGPSAIAAVYKGNLYLTRSGNPLVYTFLVLHDGTKLIIWASTKAQLQGALQYCFLMPLEQKYLVLPEGELFQITPKKIKRIGKAYQYGMNSPYVPPRRGNRNPWHDYAPDYYLQGLDNEYADSMEGSDKDEADAESSANVCEIFERRDYYGASKEKEHPKWMQKILEAQEESEDSNFEDDLETYPHTR